VGQAARLSRLVQSPGSASRFARRTGEPPVPRVELIAQSPVNRYAYYVHPALSSIAHRAWPLPSGPWMMQQTWNDLLFAHWPVAEETLRPLVPSVLRLDSFNGQCWVAVTPFHMSGVRGRWLPPIPGTARFPELNVRTYVAYGDKPGVFFFSLDAASRVAVWGARSAYHLPYFHARMKVIEENGWFRYDSVREASTIFRGRYRPLGSVRLRQRGTLEHWLTERYCLYTVVRDEVFRAEIHHEQWPLQDAEAEISANTMANAAGIQLPNIPPLLHFSKKLEVLVWPLRKA
jgi:uncharacterized protein YqjF (DUF2071 family)